MEKIIIVNIFNNEELTEKIFKYHKNKTEQIDYLNEVFKMLIENDYIIDTIDKINHIQAIHKNENKKIDIVITYEM